MPKSGVGGSWVRFRIQFVPSAMSRAQSVGPQHGMSPGNLFVRVRSKIVGNEPLGNVSSQLGSGAVDGGVVGTLMVWVEIDRAVMTNPTRNILSDLITKSWVVVNVCAGELWGAVVNQLATSESPSRPGEPPAEDTGTLVRSIHMEFHDDRLGADVGSDLDYATYLELGTRLTGERPFLLPALVRSESAIASKIERVARGIVDGKSTREINRPLMSSLAHVDTLLSDLGDFYRFRDPPDERDTFLEALHGLYKNFITGER